VKASSGTTKGTATFKVSKPNQSPSASLADAVLSSGALNLSVGSLARSTNNQQTINPVDKALALTGTWLDV
jgi:hypothetical protein